MLTRRLPGLLLAALTTLVCAAGAGGQPDAGGHASGPLAANQEATLRIAWTPGPSSLDPALSTIPLDLVHLTLVYDRLIDLSPGGKLVPGLATGWKFSSNGRMLELTLRRGVVFHNGERFDGQTVARNFRRTLTLAGSVAARDIPELKSVRVVSPYSVRLSLTRRNVGLLGYLAGPAGLMIAPGALANQDLDQKPVGSGPFRLVEYRRDNLLVFERYDRYWDRRNAAQVRRLEVQILPNPVARLNAIRTGQTDFTFVDGPAVGAVQGQSLKVMTFPFSYYSMKLNRSRSRFGDVRVRRALGHAINRQAIIDAIFGGYGRAAVQPYARFSPAYNDTVANYYRYNPDRARQLLRDAGLASGFSFDMLVTGRQPFVSVATALQAQFRQVGIDARVIPVEPADSARRFVGERAGDALTTLSNTPPDAGQYFERFFEANSPNNPSQSTTPRMARLIAQQRAATNAKERAALLRQASGEFVTQALEIVLFRELRPFVMSPRVTGFRAYKYVPDFRGLALGG
jgi:peptide/nickel transport system substrate-binding protein